MRIRFVMLGGAATALALGAATLVVASPAVAAPADPRARAVAKLKAASDRSPTVVTDRSGVVTSLRTAPGHPLDRPAGVSAAASAETAARGVVRTHAAAFGLRNGDAALRTESTEQAAGGLEVVRFTQTVGSVPVIGADLVVTVRPDGEAVSVGSTVTTATASTSTPRVSADGAAVAARHAVIRAEKLRRNARLTSSRPELRMYDPAIVGAPGSAGLRPVWEVTVRGDGPTGPIAAKVLVDARVGTTVLYVNQLQSALDRRVCDYGRTLVDLGEAYEPGSLCPANGGPVKADEINGVAAGAHYEVGYAFRYTAQTHDFYRKLFGRDSLDGNGMTIASSVRVCPAAPPGYPDDTSTRCYPNAFWDGKQMVYGPGFSLADDVVAHELTHGVIEHTANLFYGYQSGAINESMADVFGEFLDLTNKADRSGIEQSDWALGEDLPGGAIRSMSNPAAYDQPATMTSPEYLHSRYWDYDGDNGGVHVNSGVGNKAAYLIATGLGGGKVTGTGISKAAQLYYLTLLNLSSGADYADLASTLQASCAALAGNTTLKDVDGNALPALTTADCGVVDRAIATTEMTTPPTASPRKTPDTPYCPTGSTFGEQLWADDLEGATAADWNTTVPPPNTIEPYSSYFDTETSGLSYAHSGQRSLVQSSAGETGNSGPPGALRTTVAPAQATAIPAGRRTFLWFAHADLLDADMMGSYDGGRVSATYTDAGVTHKVDLGTAASDTPPANGYNNRDGLVITPVDPTNPTPETDGMPAFTGESFGWGSSRFELTPLAGQTITPTFDLAGDSVLSTGWFLDDFRIYTCTGAQPGGVQGIAGKTTRPGATSATVSWVKPDWPGDAGLDHYRVSHNGTSTTVPAGTTRTTLTGVPQTEDTTVTVTPYTTTDEAGPGRPLILKPARTTLTISPQVVAYRKAARFSGTVVRPGTSTKIVGAPVRIERRLRGSTVWTTLTTRTTASNGTWSASVAATQNADYRAAVDARVSGWLPAREVGPTAVTVTPPVSASFRTGTIRLGQTAKVTVKVAPARRVVVELQRRSGSRWVVVQRLTTFTNGAASMSVKPTARGKASYRVVSRADRKYRSGVSATKTLTVQ